MSQAVSIPLELEGALSPLVGRLASRLTRRTALGRGQHSDDMDLISELLTYAAAAEQQLNEQQQRIRYLESLSMTDELTGIANRRAFETFLENALADARRHDERGVLGFFDLDDFKAVNDAHGHLAGDAILAHVASVVNASIRPFDCAARLGGDEFGVILTRCNPRGGIAHLRAIQAALAEDMVPISGRKIRVTASLGFRAFDGESQIRALLFDADRAMYREKRRRNMF